MVIVCCRPSWPGKHSQTPWKAQKTQKRFLTPFFIPSYLKKAGIIDYVNDAKNLALALNHDHLLEYAKAVLKRLEDAVKAAKKNGTSIKFEVEKALSEIREVLLRGDKYRY